MRRVGRGVSPPEDVHRDVLGQFARVLQPSVAGLAVGDHPRHLLTRQYTNLPLEGSHLTRLVAHAHFDVDFALKEEELEVRSDHF